MMMYVSIGYMQCDENHGAVGMKTRGEIVEWRHNRSGKPIDKSRGRHNRLWRLRLISQGLASRRTDKLKMGFKEPKRITLIFLFNQQLLFHGNFPLLQGSSIDLIINKLK
jgi:hypothetical protein